MIITMKNVCMADGTFFEKVTADVPESFLKGFIKMQTEKEQIYIEPEYIVSFEVEPVKPRKVMLFKNEIKNS